MKNKTILKLDNVRKVYLPGKVPVRALENISLEIEEGEFAILGGPSGSGKSTLLNLMGLIDRPSAGKVYLHGEELAYKNEKKLTRLRKDLIGFIFQNFNLIPTLTVFENVEYPIMGIMKDLKLRRDWVRQNLEKVGLSGLAKRYPSEISGGQQQRVSIARAFAKRPKLILADEPTANLDSVNGKNILDLMAGLNSEDRTTFILASHDAQILKMAHRQIRMSDGKILEDRKKGGNP